jgi:hypothetical protein
MSRALEADLPSRAVPNRAVPSPAVATRGVWSRGRGGVRRWYTVLVLALCVLLTPSVTGVLQDVLALWTGVECCEGDACGAKGGSFCAHPCAHCSCCAHPAALPAAAGLVPLGDAPAADAIAPGRRERVATGYRAPPYRPPAV